MSKVSNARYVLLAALAVSLLSALVASGSPPEDEGIRRVSPRFGRWGAGESPDGREYFVLFDDKGDVAKVIPLESEVARYGKGDHFAIVSWNGRDTAQGVRVFDGRGDLVSRFSVPSDRNVGVVGDMVLLSPRSDHSVGSAFDLEFLRLDGSFLSALRYEGLSRRYGEEFSNGHTLFGSLEFQGETPRYAVHHLDSEGRAVWKFDVGKVRARVFVLAPSARFAVVGTSSPPSAPPGRDNYYLLDEAGSVIVSGHLPHLHQGLFSPDDRYVVLVGSRTIRLLRTIDGSEIWSAQRTRPLALGSALAFSPDGSKFCVVGQDSPRLGTPGPAWVTSYSIEQGTVAQSDQILDQLATNRRLTLVGLTVDRNGAANLITHRSGIHRVTP